MAKICKKCKGSGKKWGMEVGSGSMGLGLPMAVGLALAKKLKGEEGNVYVLMSDGEMQIGTTWESALIAAQHQLDNLVVIVDNNGLQAMGATADILSLHNLETKFRSFGWATAQINGHSYLDIDAQLSVFNLMPKVIIALTVKGKGVPFMENNNLYHYKAPSEEEYLQAKNSLI